ncbi:MAG: HU family DNA-binding protein [Candidatus Zixiibacteriota bacterium]|nr:MAG: HU family DNA-binding protein [candidate division Zixibacteria bacterium]
MNKDQMIEKVVEEVGITKSQATKAVKSLFDGIVMSLQQGNKVSVSGFGTFDISNRKARTGRNPQTGEEIQIAASKVPKFKAGKAFKEALN